MNCPTTVAELQALVDNAVPEDLHLDYKSSAIFEKTRDDLKLDLAKDVSAFANSDGGLDDLTTKLNAANETLKDIASIGGATGLDLSVRTVKNLRHLLARDGQIERIPASGVPWQVFAEVLDIDRQLAQRIEWAIRWSQGRLDDLEGMTPEIANRARSAFIFEEPPESTE